MNSEVRGVIAFQLIPFFVKLLAIPNAGTPSVHLLSIHIKEDVIAIKALSVCPVVIGVYFSIKRQFCKQKVDYRPCHSSVVVSLLVGMFVSKQRRDIQQFIENKIEDLASLALRYLLQFHVV